MSSKPRDLPQTCPEPACQKNKHDGDHRGVTTIMPDKSAVTWSQLVTWPQIKNRTNCPACAAALFHERCSDYDEP